MSKRNRHTAPQKTDTLVSIIIPIYGRFDLLNRCIEALPEASKGLPYEVILVDNASPDKDEAFEFYRGKTEFKLFKNNKNEGFPKACNQGARWAKSPLLFFLNSDVILEKDAIDYLVREMDDPEVGVCGTRLLFPPYAEGLNQQIRPPNKIQHVGLETDIHGRFQHSFIGWDADHPKVMKQREVYAVTGAALMTRKKIWDKIGGFDEAYGLGTYEDMSLCLSVRDLGYNVIVSVKATGIHFTGATAESQKIQYPMEYNRLIFLQKWGNRLAWTGWRLYG
jgi:GT2 family glycosyltransferase